MEAMHKMWQT